MTGATFTLVTLDRPRLTGPGGPIALQDPRAFGLLVLLALAGEEGIPVDTLLLRLTPDLTPVRGRGALRTLAETLREHLGASAIRWGGETVTLAADVVSLDVRIADQPSSLGAGPAFLRGFALPDSPEFGDWLEAARPRVIRLRPAPRGLSARTIALGIGVAAAGVLAWWLLGPRPSEASRFSPGGMVVLTDVENATGDTIFDAGLTTAAIVALEQSGHFALLPRSRVRDALSRAGIPGPDSLLTLDRAREAAAREGVRFVIAPRIATEAGGYRLSAVVLDAFTDRLVKEASTVAESRAGVLPALDRVLREVRATLGERASAGQERNEPLPMVTTPSLEALRSYALGARAWREGDYDLAEEFWHRAVDQDTGFAMAYHSIGRSKALMHDRDSATYYFTRAFARSSRLTEWERLRLEESWATDRGDGDSAVRISRTIAERFPSGVSWYNYGTTLMQSNRCEEAVPAFERALALDSLSYHSHINLATCARRNNAALALRHYEHAAAINPAYLNGNAGYELGGVLAQLGLVDSAARHFGRMAALPGLYDRTLAHRGLAFLALERGEGAEARSHFAAAVEIGKQQRAELSLVRGYLLLALADVLDRDTAAADTHIDEMLRIIRSQRIVPQMLAMAGWGMARAGRVRDAEAVLLRLRQVSNGSTDDRGAEALLVGVIAVARGQPERADSAFTAGPEFGQPRLADLMHARALDAMGRADSAERIRAEVSKTTIFGTEAHIERIFQNRSATGRTR